MRWAAILLAAGCASSPAPRLSGGVRLDAAVPEAQVIVDDELLGTVGDYQGEALPLPPGFHRIAIEHPDYQREEIEVTVTEGLTTAVAVELRRREHDQGRDGGDEDHDDHVLP